MRAELYDPGADAACPTSPRAAATIRAPTPLPPATGAVGLTVPSAPGPIAFVSMPANDEPFVALGGVEGGVGGDSAVWISAIRATTDSMLTPCNSSTGART